MHSPGPSRVLLLLLAALPLLGFWTIGHLDLDEGFYGAVVAEMNRRGEWITPYYNGAPWFEKPILLYWLAKPFAMVFGNQIGTRLPSVLCSLGLYWLVYRFTRRRFGETEGQAAALMLSSSLLMAAIGRMMMTDLPFVLTLTGCFMAFWNSLEVPEGDRGKWRGLAGLLLGLAILAKGPVAGVFFSILAAVTYRMLPDFRPRFRGGWLWGTLGMLLMVSAWYVPAYLADGRLFVEEFLIKQNVGRFLGKDVAHVASFNLLMYPLVILLGFAPWSLQLRRAWPFRWGWIRDLPDQEAVLLRYLAAWVLIIFAFFMVSSAKLVHYILPIWPPMAILVAVYSVRQVQGANVTGLTGTLWRRLWITSIVTTVLSVGGFWWHYHNIGQDEAHAYAALAREQKVPFAVYQLSRRSRDLGTGQLKLQETSLPSLAMVYDGVVKVIETPEELREFHGYLLTRSDRIPETDLGPLHLQKVRSGRKFVLFSRGN